MGNEKTVQMYRLSLPLVVRIWHKLVFWREIKTPAHQRHCRDSSKIKSLHLGPAMSPESPAPREPNDWCISLRLLDKISLQVLAVKCTKSSLDIIKQSNGNHFKLSS